MFDYAFFLHPVADVTSFEDAPQVVNSTVAARQYDAISAGGATAAQNPFQELLVSLQSELASMLTPVASQHIVQQFGANDPLLTEAWSPVIGQTTLPPNPSTVFAGHANSARFCDDTEGMPYFGIGVRNFGVQIAKSGQRLASAPEASAAAAPGAISGLGRASVGGGPVTARLGNGAHVAGLSVPHSFPGAQVASQPSALLSSSPVTVCQPITSGDGGDG